MIWIKTAQGAKPGGGGGGGTDILSWRGCAAVKSKNGG